MEVNEIIVQCKKGNAAAEKIFFQRYANKVFTLCRRYFRQRETAYDLMQDCFILLFDSLDKYDSNKGSFEGWLHRVCTNVVLKKIKKDQRSISFVYPDKLPEIEDYFVYESFDEITTEFLLACIHELPDGYREILNLHIFEGLKHTEIAEALGITASTSRSQYTRAKKLLKNILQKKIASKNKCHARRLA